MPVMVIMWSEGDIRLLVAEIARANFASGINVCSFDLTCCVILNRGFATN